MSALADDTWLVLPPLLILAGIVGIIVPVLPGLLLTVLGLLVWALTENSVTGWVVLALGLLVGLTGAVLQYLVPGRRMKRQGVRTSTLALAVLLAVVGFFVIPVVGAVVGFVLGIWLVESGRGARGRRRGRGRGTPSSPSSRAWGIELAAALGVAGLYVVGLLVT